MPASAPSTSKLLEVAVRASQHYLTKSPDVSDYLYSRGLRAGTIASWRLGYWHPDAVHVLRASGFDDPIIEAHGLGNRLSHRVTLPLTDPLGDPHALAGRSSSAAPRWLYPQKHPGFDRRTHLLGLDQCVEASKSRDIDTLVLVEGPFDCVLSHQDGILAVCAHGTTFTHEQALLMRGLTTKTLIACPDGGEPQALQNMTKSMERWKHSLPNELLVATLPAGEDPASLVQSQPALLHDCLAAAKPLT